MLAARAKTLRASREHRENGNRGLLRAPWTAQTVRLCKTGLRTDRVAQLDCQLLVGQRGVNDDLAVQNRVLCSLDSSLRLGGGELVVVLVGHDADAALGQAELDFGAPVGLTGIPLVEDPDDGVADVLEAGGQRQRCKVGGEGQLLVGVDADEPCLAGVQSSLSCAVARVAGNAPDDVALVVVDHGVAELLGDGGVNVVVGVAGVDLDVGVDGQSALNEAGQEVVDDRGVNAADEADDCVLVDLVEVRVSGHAGGVGADQITHVVLLVGNVDNVGVVAGIGVVVED